MSRTVTALYDTRAEAEAAKQRLSSAVDVESCRIIDKDSSGSSDQQQGSSLGSLGISNEDRHAYGEGLNRGGFLLCAEVDSDENADEIVRVLEQTSSVDLDDRQTNWKSEGWAPFGGDSGFGAGDTKTGSDTRMGGGDTRMESGTTQEEHIPIVEEHLNVGKRQVERGGARVRSYVRETPVHEQVNLREEHVSVERRPVNETQGRGELDSDMLQERTIEMTETSEVPVVEKEARVTEEMVIRKTADQRTEEIEDTVRHTEVDVDETSGEKRDSAFGFGGGSQSDSESKADFERTDRDRDR